MGKSSANSGQVLIIILLVMIVGLTTGLFLLGRTTSDVALSNKLEESARAFNAAEIGIEEAILSGVGASILPLPSGVSYTVNLADITVPNNSIYPGTASQNTATTLGDVFTLWLVPHNEATGELIETGNVFALNPNIYVCFNSSTPTPAIGVTVIYKDNTTLPSQYRAAFVGFDPDTTRQVENNFSGVEPNAQACSTNGYVYRAWLKMNQDFGTDLRGPNYVPIALRIRPYYASTPIGIVATGQTLPKQGNQIASTGKYGDTARKIEVNQGYVVPAPFLDNAVFNTGSTNFTK